jgi:hypothetical protein
VDIRLPAPGSSLECHRGRGGQPWYGLYLTGVTASGVPCLELIQPVVERRHGHWIVYGFAMAICYLQRDVFIKRSRLD